MSKGSNAHVPTTALRAVLSWRQGGGVPDVDASMLLLGENGKVRSDADFVFYNQANHASGSVRYEGKKPGTEITDTLVVDLARVESAVDRVVIGASADGGTFGQVPALSLRLLDAAGGQELLRYDVTDASSETAFVLGEFYRRAGAWKFRAIGQGYASGLAGLATDFGISVDDDPAPTPPTSRARAGSPAAPATPGVSLKKQKLLDMEKKVAASSPQLLSLTKKAAVSLEKKGLGEHTARVAICLDISGSMSSLYRSGKIQALAERVLALGLRFDDDGEVDVFLFGRNGHSAGTLNLDNHAAYVPEMLKEFKLETATSYGAAMKLLREHYFGSSNPRSTPLAEAVPVYAMFITDGACSDEKVAREQVTSSSFEPLFWQFMAVGPAAGGGRMRMSKGGEFRFLEELDDMPGRYLDNADFFAVEDPTTIEDDALFELLMTEYPEWLKQARQKGLLR